MKTFVFRTSMDSRGCGSHFLISGRWKKTFCRRDGRDYGNCTVQSTGIRWWTKDRLRAFLKQPTATLVLIGYSFRDEHINEVIVQGLQSTQTAVALALLYDSIATYPQAVTLARSRANLSVFARDCAVISAQKSKWPEKDTEAVSTDNHTGVRWTPSDPANEGGKRTAEFTLGDFAVFGQFLEELCADLRRLCGPAAGRLAGCRKADVRGSGFVEGRPRRRQGRLRPLTETRVFIADHEAGWSAAPAPDRPQPQGNGEGNSAKLDPGSWPHCRGVPSPSLKPAHGIDFSNPDLQKVADAFGVVGMRVKDPTDVGRLVREAIGMNRPALIEVPVGRMPPPTFFAARKVPTKYQR